MRPKAALPATLTCFMNYWPPELRPNFLLYGRRFKAFRLKFAGIHSRLPSKTTGCACRRHESGYQGASINLASDLWKVYLTNASMSNLQKKFPSLVRSRSENDCPMNNPQCGEVLAVRRRATSKNGTPRDSRDSSAINDPNQP